MSSTPDIFKSTGTDAQRDELARRAVLEGRRLVSTLTSYARALTRDSKVMVQMATRDNGSTDGKKIFWRPPVALGDRSPHQRSVCNKRDKDLQLLCTACAKRENVLSVIYHEIAHICFNSFQEVAESDKISLITDAVRMTDGKYAEAVEKRIKTAPSFTKNSYIGMTNLISEFLPLIFNVLEDARVNRELFKVRKGTKAMFDALCAKVFTEGVEQLDALGKTVLIQWRDYPLNTQVTIGLFCKASGYAYSSWFQPEVVEALNDAELTGLVNQLDTVRTAQGVYHLGFPILARLRELGFCKLPDEPDKEDEEESGEGSSGNSSGQENSSEPSDSDSGTDSESGSDSGVSGSSSEGNQTSSDKAGDSSSQGEDSDPDSGNGENKPKDGNQAPSSDLSGSDDDDKSGNSGGVDNESGAGPDESQESESGQGEGSSDSESTVKDSSSGCNLSGKEDSSEPECDSESNLGTGTISGPPITAPEGGSVNESNSESPPRGGGSTGNRNTASQAGTLDNQNSGTHPDDKPKTRDHDTEDAKQEHTVTADSLGDKEDSSSTFKDEPIDTGADSGVGGTEVVENEKNDKHPTGTAKEARVVLLKLGDHEEAPKKIHETENDAKAVDRAIIQGIYFETPSRNILGVREHRFGKPIRVDGQNMSQAWNHSAWYYAGNTKKQLGVEGDFDPPEQILAPALVRMRVAFTDNQRGKDHLHLKAGRVDGRVLGRRAWADDERLFRRRTQPGKKSYFVVIGMDVSGSTLGKNIALEKRAVMAQAELCHRMGIKFAVIAHSGKYHFPSGTRSEGLDLDMYIIKDANQPWNDETKAALRAIGPDAANLDGHSLEYYRKFAERRPETDKIIMYYSDGKMPAENHDEELMILQREIKTCKRKNILLLGVGIRTDSPSRHGLDTVQVDTDQDIQKVVRHLEKRLSIHVSV